MRRSPIGSCLLAIACVGAEGPTHEGRYTFGHEVNAFQPCGQSTTYWVQGSDSTLARLRAVHDSLTDQPYQPIYARVRGDVVPGRGDGFAADYDGLFRIDSVLTTVGQIPSTCAAPGDTTGRPGKGG